MSQVNQPSIPGQVGMTPVFRPLQSVDLSRTVQAFPGLEVVGELDDVLKQPLEVTMMDDWSAYFNAHTMMEAAKLYTGRITAWRFLPDPIMSQIIFLQAQNEKEYGATEVKHSETEAGTTTNLRRPMQSLGVQRHAGRVWSFPLVVRTGADGKEYLAITLKGATTRPVVSRKKQQAATANPGTGTTTTAGTTTPTGAATTGNAAPSETTAATAPTGPVATVGIVPAAGSDTASAVQPGATTQGTPAPSGGDQKPARTKAK